MKNAIKLFVFFSLVVILSFAVFALPSAVTSSDTVVETEITHREDIQAELSADGTESSPYVITCAAEFNNFSSLIKSNNAVYGNKYYKLCGNVDFSSSSLVPFGTKEAPFTGTIDGDGYAITNVTMPDVFYSGVVGYTTGCTIKDLKVSYVNDNKRKDYSGVKYFGGIIGYSEMSVNNSLNVSGCETEGQILINTSGAFYGGGIFGYLKAVKNEGRVNDCVSNLSFDVNGKGNSYFGGFVAYQFNGSSKDLKIKNCVNYGDIKAVIDYYEVTAGGFAGYVNKDASGWSDFVSLDANLAATVYNFENCISSGNVDVKSKSIAHYGFFTGTNSGEGSAAYSNCYYDKTCTATADSKTKTLCSSGTATTSQNITSADFLKKYAFDFDNKWYLFEGMLKVRNVAKSLGAGTVSDKKDLRLSSTPGLRFQATIDTSKRDYSFEYGFIVARKDELAGEELTFDFNGRKVSGVAFDSTTDKFIDKDDLKVTVAGVVSNIPETNYGTELVARTYVKFKCDGKEEIVYGNAETSSINLSAQAIRNSESYEYLTENQKSLLETMLP